MVPCCVKIAFYLLTDLINVPPKRLSEAEGKVRKRKEFSTVWDVLRMQHVIKCRKGRQFWKGRVSFPSHQIPMLWVTMPAQSGGIGWPGNKTQNHLSFSRIAFPTLRFDVCQSMILTCEVAQPQLPQTVVPFPSVVEEDCQRVATLVQFGASDDP